MGFEETVEAIPYQYPHPKILHGLIRWLVPAVVVEVGTHIGMSACWMARALQQNNTGHLYCIDSFCWVNETQEEQWNRNLTECGVRDWVTHIRGRSEEVAWPEHVDFVYVDGNHTYPVCKHDGEKARELGARVVCFHDSVSWEGSRKYTEEIRRTWKGWDFLEEVSEGGLLIAKRRDPKGLCEGVDIGECWDKPSPPAPGLITGAWRKLTEDVTS